MIGLLIIPFLYQNSRLRNVFSKLDDSTGIVCCNRVHSGSIAHKSRFRAQFLEGNTTSLKVWRPLSGAIAFHAITGHLKPWHTEFTISLLELACQIIELPYGREYRQPIFTFFSWKKRCFHLIPNFFQPVTIHNDVFQCSPNTQQRRRNARLLTPSYLILASRVVAFISIIDWEKVRFYV